MSADSVVLDVGSLKFVGVQRFLRKKLFGCQSCKLPLQQKIHSLRAQQLAAQLLKL